MRVVVMGLLLAAVWAALTTSTALPIQAADEQATSGVRSGRRYWLEQAERDRDRERQRRQDDEQYHRQSDERQRRWAEWWSRRQPPQPMPSESE